MRIGITGHRGLTADTERLVDRALREHLASLAGTDPTDVGGLAGVSCLAAGADQLFARAVLYRGGRLEAIIPASEYRAELPATARAGYDVLLGQAACVDRLPFAETSDHAYMAASQLMLERVDTLIAVWDGQPTRGFGGTADVVREAQDRGIPVTVIWPPGAERGD